MNKTILFLVLLSFNIFLSGCSEIKEVAYQQLMDRTKQWVEPKVAIWYYVGSALPSRDLGDGVNLST